MAPHRGFPLWSLANLYEELSEWDKAQRLYERALGMEPDDAVANMNFGRMLEKKGEFSDAKIYLTRALFLDPSYAAVQRLLADIL